MSIVRRTPRYGRFIWTGVLLGLVLAFVLALARSGEGTGAGTALIYLGALLATIGGVAGALAAVLLERRTGE
ncbi:hypothetical protein [Motilibacter aurantiacus]|uniref:hypothetical protein n=1 Tax=Motilibacter aurantiacus TaxID=2714955 RepID=UPI00140DB841|nr:hypothetical protein [Motilibacter aurantiacus]NHC47282.1 hypothetical protein [Motilibacter aurantiacus]